jgi:hypothetical protein
VTHKSRFFEVTHAKKAYDDRVMIMKYRKCVLTSYIILKYRLDKMFILQQSKPEHHRKLMTMTDRYVGMIDARHLRNIHQYDECFLAKLKVTSKLSSIELQSLISFYEVLTHLINVHTTGQYFNPNCQEQDASTHNETTEMAFKAAPDYKYVNLEHLSREHVLFPDYDYDLMERDFCSYLVKIVPQSFPRKVDYDHPDHYYKRIFVDGSSAPPLEEQDFQLMKDSY